MKARAVRLHGANDLRLDEFELPAIKEDEILVKVISDSICMSTYKCAVLGTAHKRVHPDVAEHPAIMGHEFAGEIVQVGEKHRDRFRPGMKFAQQPALNYKGTMWSPGYSYEFFGGDATYCIIPAEVMELGCLMEYRGRAFYEASLAEPMSCCIGAFHACYHTRMGCYEHEMGIMEGGRTAILAGAGPMGLGAVAYALCCDRRPGMLVVADQDQARLDRARSLFSDQARMAGIDLRLVNTAQSADPAGALRALTGGAGFDDVFAFAPVSAVVELSSAVLGRDGCLNFFAGPMDPAFNTDDLMESLDLSARGLLDPAVMVTHIGGLDAAAEATLRLPELPGGKKLIYTQIDMPLTAIEDFPAKAAEDPRFGYLADLCLARRGLWCPEAEAYLLEHWTR